jgi:phosphatidylserine decarboxylase
MDLLQSNALLRSYFLLPHRLLNRSFSRLAMRSRPAWAVQAAIRAWTRTSQLDLRDFEEGPFATVQEFFLRRLRAGARPIGAGFVSPVDGFMVAAGPVAADTALTIKGCEMSMERVVNGAGPSERETLTWSLAPYVGGHYAVLFLTPEGYHRLHMPADGTVVGWRWIPGRFFPQNASALSRIAGVYERNERVSLRVRLDDGNELLMVLVGASLVGGIHVEGLDLESLQAGGSEARIESGTTSLRRRKGDELGHFRFGSTIVLVLPPGLGAPLSRPEGCGLKMGETLF